MSVATIREGCKGDGERKELDVGHVLCDGTAYSRVANGRRSGIRREEDQYRTRERSGQDKDVKRKVKRD